MARARVKLRLPDEDPLGLWQQHHHQAQQGASHSWQDWQQQHHQAQQGAQNRHDGQEQGPQTWEQEQQGPWQQGQQRPWAQSDQQSQQGTGTSQIASPPIATQQASGMLPHHQGPKARHSEGRRTTVKARTGAPHLDARSRSPPLSRPPRQPAPPSLLAAPPLQPRPPSQPPPPWLLAAPPVQPRPPSQPPHMLQIMNLHHTAGVSTSTIMFFQPRLPSHPPPPSLLATHPTQASPPPAGPAQSLDPQPPLEPPPAWLVYGLPHTHAEVLPACSTRDIPEGGTPVPTLARQRLQAEEAANRRVVVDLTCVSSPDNEQGEGEPGRSGSPSESRPPSWAEWRGW